MQSFTVGKLACCKLFDNLAFLMNCVFRSYKVSILHFLKNLSYESFIFYTGF
jgi:hypothetical protein